MIKLNTICALLGVLAILLGASAMANMGQTTPSNQTGIVDINTANLDQLMTLPGIGASKAKAIIDYRTQKKFDSVEELLEIKGIGEKLLAKIKPYVVISPNLRAPGTAVTPSKG